jgi:hypothetical protein
MVMGKTNWKRMFLGGLLTGFVFIILEIAVLAIYLEDHWISVFESLNPNFQVTPTYQGLWILNSFISAILAVWLYSAIRPRYGAGPKTAVIAGIAFWIMRILLPAVAYGSTGLFPVKLLVIEDIFSLIICILGTLLGAWVYKEQT